MIHYWGNTLFITLSSRALWDSDGSFGSSSLAVVIHICRNNLLDDTSGPVANSNPEMSLVVRGNTALYTLPVELPLESGFAIGLDLG